MKNLSTPKALVIILGIICGFSLGAQTTVTINGTGVATDAPFDIYAAKYTACGDIYEASEINTSGTITVLVWNNFSCPVITLPTVKIYMKLVPTTTTSWASETYATAISGATLVYSGNYPSTNNGFANPITLTTPFAYTTANNLEIITESDYGSVDANEPSWYYSTTTTNTDCEWYSTSQAGLSSANNSSTGGIDNTRPAIRMTFTSTCAAPTITNFTPSSACAGSGATISVSGTNFVSGSTTATVNGVAATVGFVDTNNITLTLPAGATGTGNIVITTCGSVTSASTFTVNTAPSISGNPSTTAQNLCSNQAATALSVTASGTPTLTYQWYENTTNSNSGGTLIGGATSSVYTPNTSATGTEYYYCVVGGACSPAATSAVSGAVNVTPATQPATLYNVTGGGTYCSGGGGLTVGLSGSQSGLSYQLQLNGSNIGAPVTGPGSAFSFPAQTAAGTYAVIASGGCYATTKMADSVVIALVNAVPATPGAISGPDSLCNGSAGNFSIDTVSGATSYVWTLPGGWNGNSTTDSINATAGASGGNITVKAQNACGVSTGSASLAVSVSGSMATPTAIIGHNSVCASSSVIYSVAPVTGATSYTWSLPGSWTGTSATDSISAGTGASGGTISVTANGNCGSSAAQTLAVTVLAAPVMPSAISGPATICNSGTDTFYVAAVNGATSYIWTLPNGWTGTSSTDTIIATTNANAGTVSVEAHNGCGTSTAQTLSVATGAAPAMPGTISQTNSSVCSGGADTFSVAAVNGATSYTWTLPNGWAGTSTTNSINAVAGSNGGTVSVTANNGCGSSQGQTLNVVFGAAPTTPGAITGTANVCSGGADTLSIASVNGATSYTWTLPNGWTGSSTTNSIITATGGSGTVSVTANNTCGSSSAQTLSVTVGSAPAMPGAITGSTVICSGTATGYSVATVNGATSYTWNLPNGWTGTSSTESIDVTPSGAGTISITANNACGSSAAQTLAVNTGAVPATPGAISGPDSICNGSQATFSIDTVAGATSYVWGLPNNWMGTSTTNSILATGISTTGNVTVNAVNGCGQSAVQSKVVAINQLPAVSLNLGSNTVCNNMNPILALSGGQPGGGTFSGQGVSGTNFDASSLSAGNYVVTYAYTNNKGCTGTDTATVIVTVCSGIDNTVESQISIFPNPFTDALVINTHGNYGKGYALLMDATGRQISRTEFEAGAMSVVLNTGAIANGAYLLNIMVDGKSVAVRKVFRME